jgi:hypothetical protein
MAEPLAPLAERQTWSLATLAEEAGFDAHIEVVAGAIADRFALKIHRTLSPAAWPSSPGSMAWWRLTGR